MPNTVITVEEISFKDGVNKNGEDFRRFTIKAHDQNEGKTHNFSWFDEAAIGMKVGQSYNIDFQTKEGSYQGQPVTYYNIQSCDVDNPLESISPTTPNRS